MQEGRIMNIIKGRAAAYLAFQRNEIRGVGSAAKPSRQPGSAQHDGANDLGFQDHEGRIHKVDVA
jgi:hypothetical protein